MEFLQEKSSKIANQNKMYNDLYKTINQSFKEVGDLYKFLSNI